MMQLSADRKSDTGKENIAQEANSGGKSTKKKQKSSVLLRPVSKFISYHFPYKICYDLSLLFVILR